MSRRKRGSRDAVSGTLAFALKVAFWGGVLLLALGFVSVSCEAFGRGLSGASGGDGGEVVVVAARETTSELRAEMHAQALDAAGYRVERKYGLSDADSMTRTLTGSDGAFVIPAQSSGPEPDAVELSSARMLSPTREAVEGAHPAPVVGEEWSREHRDAVEALDETTAALSAREFERMVEAVDSGESLVVAEVYRWRERNGLPPAPGVRPPQGEPTEEGVRV